MGCTESKTSKNKVQPENQDDITPKIYLNDHYNSSNSDIKSTSRISELSSRRTSRRPSKVSSTKPAKPEIEIVGSVVENGKHEQYVDLCEWSPKSDILVTASSDPKANLWNAQVISNMNISGLPLANDNLNISALTWSDNGKLFVTGSENGIVSAWTSNGKPIQSWTAHNSSGVKSVKINSNHDLIVSGSTDETCIYSLSLKKAKLLCWNQSEVTALEWLTKDTFLAGEASGMVTMDKVSASEMKPLEEYDQDDFIPESEPMHQCQSHIGGIYKLLLHPINREVCASCSVDCTVKVWNFQAQPYSEPMTLEGHFGYVTDITWLSTSHKLASASYDGTVKIWDAYKAECLFTLQEGLGYVQCLSATKSGLYLASAGHDGTVYFWNTKTGMLVSKHDGPGRLMTVTFNSANNKVAVTSYGSVTILELSFHHPQ